MKESFGHYLRKRRKDFGMNQTQLAVKLNMDAAKLSKIENGKMTVDESRLNLISRALKIDLKTIKIRYYGDCIAQTLYKNKCNDETLMVAEEILNYYKTTNVKQGNLIF
jgi:HTH-type transcriptional regulator, competence development regulator